MGAIDHARTRDREPVHAHHRRTEGEDMSLDVVTVIVGEDSGDGVYQGGIHIGPTRVHALARLFGGGIVYRRGDAHLVMSEVGLGMGEEVGVLDLGATRYVRAGHDRDLPPDPVRARDHIPLIRGIVAGVDRDQLVAAEGVLVILGIAGRGHPHDCDLLFWLIKVFCNVTDGSYHLPRNMIHIKISISLITSYGVIICKERPARIPGK